MARTARNARRSTSLDPFAMLVGGMRRVASMDIDDVTQAVQQFSNPDACFLEMLGRDRPERVERMAAMLRSCSEEDLTELGVIFGEAMARNHQEQARRAQRQPHQEVSRLSEERPRRRPTAAERRQQRRRAS